MHIKKPVLKFNGVKIKSAINKAFNDPNELCVKENDWKTLSKSCPWKTISGCCVATKIECSKQLCAVNYWLETSESKCGCTGITE